MKKIITLIIFASLFATSCSSSDSTEGGSDRDGSLAGSISYYFDNSNLIIYDGEILREDYNKCDVNISKADDSHIDIIIESRGEAEKYILSVFDVPIKGVPYNVTASYESESIRNSLQIGEEIFTSMPIKLEGWLKDSGAFTRNVWFPIYVGEWEASIDLEGRDDIVIEAKIDKRQ